MGVCLSVCLCVCVLCAHVGNVLRLCENYKKGKKGFNFDPQKAKRQREAREKRAYEEKCRKKYVARMERKAKRLGKSLEELLKATSVPGGHVYGADPSWLAESQSSSASNK
eukprot:jgi/Bigna1/90711/estExt_fgenesh1_pg.C_770055